MASLAQKLMKSLLPEANPHGSSCPNSTITKQVTAPEKRLASSFWLSEALLLWGGCCQSRPLSTFTVARRMRARNRRPRGKGTLPA